MKLLTVLTLVLFTACSGEVCTVGNVPITERDLLLRGRVSEVYYPAVKKEHAALAQLIKGYLAEAVLQSTGQKVDDAVLDAEAKRIDENTQSPGMLKKIKDIYGADRNEYKKTFIRIVYAERFLYNEVFLKSEEIHKEQHEKATDFLKAALRSPGAFPGIAKQRGFAVSRLRLSPEDGIIDIKRKRAGVRYTGEGIEQARRIINELSGVTSGAVCPRIIEWQESYQVVRLIAKKGREHVIDSVSIAKRDYDEWFWETAAKVPVRIHDKALREKLLAEVSWAKNLNVARK